QHSFDRVSAGRSSAESSLVQRALQPGKRTLTEALTPSPTPSSPPSAAVSPRSAMSRDPVTPGAEPIRGAGHPPLALQSPFARHAVQQAQAGAAGADRAPSRDEGAVHAAAARGAATPSSVLPYAGAIQRAFGRHDVSAIQAHVGSDAALSARDMGASAY